MAYKSSNPGAGEASGKTIDIKPLLPPGMEVNQGDIIELKVEQASGDAVMAGYNYGEEGGEGGEYKEGQESESPEMAGPAPVPGETGETMKEGESWEDEFRREMSPRKKEGAEY